MKRVLGGVDVSYLAPRDPSILSRNDRPMPRKLNLTFGEENAEEEPHCNVKVFLRVKPLITVEVGPEVPSFKIVGSDSLATTSWIRRKQVVQQFRFSAVLPERASQRVVFDSVARRPLQDLINLQRSGLIFTYGTTNAGKTHTMFGDEADPGLIPLSLSAVFSSLEESLIQGCKLKPSDAGVMDLDPDSQVREAALRATLLEWDPKLGEDTYSISMMSGSHQAPSAPEPTLPRVALHANLRQGQRANVWVSGVEVYQEQAFDLLASSQQTALTLRGDSVRGLTLVPVESAAEAQRLMLLARHRLHSAATRLNLRSSRSHCVFSVRIAVATPKKPNTQMQFDFVDLAGSERADKTGNRGLRLMESSKINQSLSVLGRCLKAMRANQKGGNEVVPFRDSLLTRLLKTPLLSLGGENVSLLVCASAEAKTFPETCKALEFASVARRVQLRLPPRANHSTAAPSRFSLLAVARPSHAPWIASPPLVREDPAQGCRGCRDAEANTALRLAELETRLRRELVGKFSDILREEGERHSRELHNQERRLMELVKHREEHMIATMEAQEREHAKSGHRDRKRARAESAAESGESSCATTDQSDSDDEDDGELDRAAAAEIIQLRDELSAAAKAVADAEFRAAHAELRLRETLTGAAGASGRSLEAEVEQLNALLEEARTDHLQYRSDIEMLHEQLQAANEDIALKEIKLDDAVANVEELRACLDARPKTRARSDDLNAQRRVTEAMEKVAQLETANGDLAAKVAAHETTEAQLLAQIRALKTSEEELQAKKSEETDLQAKITALQMSETELKAKITALQMSETELKAKITALQMSETELKAKITALQMSDTELQAKISALETSEAVLRFKVTTHNTSEDELVGKMAALETASTSKVTTLESALAAREAEAALLRESMERRDAELAALRQQAVAEDRKESDLELEVKRLLQYQMSITDELMATSAALHTAKTAHACAEESIRSLGSENAILAGSMEQQRRESDESSARAAASFAQLEELLRREREALALAKRDCAAATQQLYRLTPSRRPRSLSLGNAPDDAKENSAVGANLGPPEPRPMPRSSKRLTRKPSKAAATTPVAEPKKSTRKLFVQRESFESPEPSPELKPRTRSHRK